MHCPKCQFDNEEAAKFCEEGYVRDTCKIRSQWIGKSKTFIETQLPDRKVSSPGY
jgi:hypothetical protein